MEKKEGTLIVSLDFELFWGMMDCSTLESYGKNVIGGRNAIPQLLELFQKHKIHATWATVGFMFAENKAEMEKYFPQESLRPTYKNSALSPYGRMKEISDDKASYFFASDLIRQISETPGQEIGSHTFSHFYCREEGQTTEQFRADMMSAINIASEHGYSLSSVVFPRNQCTEEHVEVLRNLGFKCYRDEENDWIHEKIKFRPLMRILRLADVYLPLTGQGGYRCKTENGIVNLPGSRMYKPILKELRGLERLKIRRIKKQMLHAAKEGLTFHLWWHPHNIGIMTEEHMRQLNEIFSYYDELREKYGMISCNMTEAADAAVKSA